MQAQYLARVVVVNEARWLSDIDCLFQLSIEDSGFHVHVVDNRRTDSNLATGTNTNSKSTPCF